jgi:glycogen operon protein
MLAGDEVGNSQSGNNNAYCQDNEIGWVDWSGLGREEDDLTDLVAQLTAVRRSFPQLQGERWLVGHRGGGNYDVKWLTPVGTEMTQADWFVAESRFLSYVLAPLDASGVPLYIVLNAATEGQELVLPKWPGCNSWARILATVADDSEAGDAGSRTGGPRVGAKYVAPALSVTVFAGMS